MNSLDGDLQLFHIGWVDPTSVISLVTEHLQLRPRMQAQDIYKLLYQGVMGAEHLMNLRGKGNAAGEFKQRLRAELEGIEPYESEPLCESIHPTGMLQRLNLRTYKAQGGELARLVAACMEAAHKSWGRPEELRSAWGMCVSACQQGDWPRIALSEMMNFSDWLEAHCFPAVHHSLVYREAYRPAYRLVARSTF